MYLGRRQHMAETTENRAADTGTSRRAILLGFVLLVLIAPGAFYGELKYGATYFFAAGVPAMAPLVILFLLTALNPVVRRVGWRGLSRRELLAVYAVVLVGGPLVTHGILAWMLPHNLVPRYVARARPEWEATFVEHIPDWFSPTDPVAVENYFLGGTSVPWAEWALPLAAWSSFFIALFLCTLCVLALFSRQWITHERLSFPLAQVPLELVREGRGEDGRRGRLPVVWAFWIGFLIPVIIGFVNGMANFFPAIPSIPLTGRTLMQRQAVGPLAGLGSIELNLEPWMVSIGYLIPKELSFSCWFFWFTRVGMTVAAIAGGATPQVPEGWYESTFPAPYYQGGGAVLALGAWALWTGRRYLARSLRIAFGVGGAGQDAGEPMAYRWAVVGFLLTFGYMVYFCWMSGARILVGAILVGLIVAYYVMWARLRADTGLGFLPFPLGVEDMILLPFGSSILRPREAVAIIGLRWTYFPGFGESYEVVTGNALEAFKIADSARIRQRRLVAAIVVGFLISVAVGIYVVLTGMYHYGYYNTRAASSGWLHSQLRGVGGRVYNMLTSPTKFDLNGTIAMLAGGSTAVVLGALRLRFWWWPLHPYGYLAANCWGMHWYWMPLFVGWLFKTLAIRYGGLQLYRRTVPLAIGLIVGDMASSGMWVGLNLILAGRV
jgi:hypothetical protein